MRAIVFSNSQKDKGQKFDPEAMDEDYGCSILDSGDATSLSADNDIESRSTLLKSDLETAPRI